MKLKVDQDGQLSIHNSYKLPERKEETKITSVAHCDRFFFVGLNDGSVQAYIDS